MNANTFGVAVSDFCLGTVATGNGGSPDPLVPAVFAVDLAWDTTGVANCWKDDTNDTQFPPLLPTCP